MCLLKQKGAAKYRLWEYHQLFYPAWVKHPTIFSSLAEAHNWVQQYEEIGTRFRITKNGQITLRGTR